MIINIKDFDNFTTNQYDIILIGAGIASISLVNEIYSSDLKVLIIEKGDLNETKSYKFNNTTSKGDFKIDLINERKTGFLGTAGLWKKPGVGGHFFRFDEFDFKRNEVWPIEYNEIEKYYHKAIKFLNLQDQFDEIDKLKNDFNINSDLVILNNFFNLKFGSSYLAKKNRFKKFSEKIKLKIYNSKNIHLIGNIEFKKFILNKKLNTIEKILVQKNKREFTLDSKIFILASGCFENSLNLLKLENENNIKKFNTGSFISFHPSIEIGKLYLKKYNNYFEDKDILYQLKPKNCKYFEKINYSISLSPEYLLRGYSNFISSRIQVLKKTFTEKKYIEFITNFIKMIYKFDFLYILLIKFLNKFFKRLRYINISISFEHIPNKDSKLVFSNNNFDCISSLSKENKIILKNILDENVNLFEKNFDTFKKNKIDFNKLTFETNNHHHGGTLIFSKNNLNAPIDKNLKYREIENLFVLGSSIFPASSVYNPTLTIIAFSIRLSQNILKLLV